jgi:hypothetical protein
MGQLILGQYDSSLPIVKLPDRQVDAGKYNSSVRIVDNERQTRLEIAYGLGDQLVATRIIELVESTKKRFVRPDKTEFALIGEQLVSLHSPEVYRTEKSSDRLGYTIDPKSITEIIEAAKKGSFAYLFLQNMGTTLCSKGEFCTDTHVVFSKEDLEAKVMKSWKKIMK